MDTGITFHPADHELIDKYDALAARSYGHPVSAIRQLRDHVDTRVATRRGAVIAGGLGFLAAQHFGGKPVPSACLGSGCVAPEERGEHLAARMLEERIRPLQDQGAVLATLWTASTGYGRRMGWHAPAVVTTCQVAADALGRAFAPGDFAIEHGLTEDCQLLQRDLARSWNGPLERPPWWAAFQREHHDLQAYRFTRPGHPAPAGYLGLATTQHPERGAQLVVHDFWASDSDVAAAMFAFLGRYGSRVDTVTFQRTGLPPYPFLLHNLPRCRAASMQSSPPWMLRILDLPEAVRQRGWPDDSELHVSIEIIDGAEPKYYLLELASGQAAMVPAATGNSQVRFTRGQFTLWYAGGLRSVAAARLAGVHGAPQQLAQLIRATGDREPWLPEHF